MTNMLQIKVCGMRDPENIRAVAALNPDYMGFIFYPKSPRFINVYPKVELPKNIKKVGVFVNAPEEEINKQRIRYNLDVLQLHGNESPEACYLLKQSGVGIIKVFRVDESFDFGMTRRYEDFVDYFLFDTATRSFGGSGRKFNWELLKNYNNARPLFLSGGIGLDDISSILDTKVLNIKAVDVNSRFELEPGLKDVEKLRQFIIGMRSGK